MTPLLLKTTLPACAHSLRKETREGDDVALKLEHRHDPSLACFKPGTANRRQTFSGNRPGLLWTSEHPNALGMAGLFVAEIGAVLIGALQSRFFSG
jgi:hypothetical protein